MQTNSTGDPGWAGQAVRLRRLDETAEPRDVTVVRMDTVTRSAVCDHTVLMDSWKEQGIVGRADQGRVYPHDGQKFLDELPFAYRSAYLWAEPAQGQVDRTA